MQEAGVQIPQTHDLAALLPLLAPHFLCFS
jgi:hypothetical protein